MKTDLGILSPGRGAVGPVIMSSWKTQAYVKIKVIPANPRSFEQFYVRGILSALGNIMKEAVPDIANPYIDPLLTKISGYNALIRKNYNVMADANPKQNPGDPKTQKIANPFEPDISGLTFSSGQLEEADLLTATYDDTTGDTVCTWDDSTIGNGLATDKAVFIIVRRPKVINLNDPNVPSTIDDSQPAILWTQQTHTRANAGCSFTIYKELIPANLRAYLFMTREQAGKPYSSVSNDEAVTPV